MNDFQTPYDVYQEKGYSAKQTFTTIFSGGITLGIVVIAAFITVKLFSALDKEALRFFAFALLGIIFAALSIGIALALVTVFRYIQKPGVQMPGFLGRLEERLEG